MSLYSVVAVGDAIDEIDRRLAKLKAGGPTTVARRRLTEKWCATHLLAVRAVLTDQPYTGPRPWERPKS